MTTATSSARCRTRRFAVANASSTRAGEVLAVDRLVAVRLHRADLVQRLVDVGADVADAVLARPRQPPHAPAEQHDRRHHQRHPGQHEQRQLGAREREHHQSAGEEQEVADGHRDARADHGLEHRRVVGEARDHLAGTRDLEEAGRQREQVIEHGATQVGGDALAQPGHVVEARERRDRHHGDHDAEQRKRPVEFAGAARDEAAVDHELEPLPDREHRARRDQERDRRQRYLPQVGPHEAPDTRERAQRRCRRELRGVDGNAVGACHARDSRAGRRTWGTPAANASVERGTNAGRGGGSVLR